MSEFSNKIPLNIPQFKKVNKTITYPQLSNYIQQSYISSLCITCNKKCKECSWLSNFTPIPNWEAIPTVLKHSKKEKPVPSYKVLSCPNYEIMTEYYGCNGDLIRLLSYYCGRSYVWGIAHKQSLLKAYKVYSKRYPRSDTKTTQEKKMNFFQKLMKYQINREKIQKKQEKLLKKEGKTVD